MGPELYDQDDEPLEVRPVLVALTWIAVVAGLLAAFVWVLADEAHGQTTDPTPSPWDSVAACESGGNWAIDTGNSYYGGLQFTQATWNNVAAYFGWSHLLGVRPSSQSRETQIAVAEHLAFYMPGGGLGHWPHCGRYHSGARTYIVAAAAPAGHKVSCDPSRHLDMLSYKNGSSRGGLLYGCTTAGDAVKVRVRTKFLSGDPKARALFAEFANRNLVVIGYHGWAKLDYCGILLRPCWRGKQWRDNRGLPGPALYAVQVEVYRYGQTQVLATLGVKVCAATAACYGDSQTEHRPKPAFGPEA